MSKYINPIRKGQKHVLSGLDKYHSTFTVDYFTITGEERFQTYDALRTKHDRTEVEDIRIVNTGGGSCDYTKSKLVIELKDGKKYFIQASLYSSKQKALQLQNMFDKNDTIHFTTDFVKIGRKSPINVYVKAEYQDIVFAMYEEGLFGQFNRKTVGTGEEIFVCELTLPVFSQLYIPEDLVTTMLEMMGFWASFAHFSIVRFGR